ncbi:DUF2730 family protein [Aestuariivirga sp. YIM B02566]|uniref:DUF2730 family protein n=1 Tax=Taklimakanibacter albus TaxID=2800327 RepID=A0ACC5R6J4_9HYPH|nr:DUF2730 family protein [Aestuariivirga sp. YIM B02566]MBK1868269.1 DUF2730 family protein [Aestuariivirga sp. YIM B02566]
MDQVNWGWMISGAAFVWTVYLTFWTRHSQSKKAAEKDVTDLRDKVTKLETGFAGLEQKVDDMPTSDAIHKIELGMTEMQGKLNVFTEKLTPIAATVNRVETFLMNSSKDR